MFLVDDAILCPFKGFLWIVREIYAAAVEDSKNEAEGIRQELSQLYRELERGAISESDFDLREQALLDRLDRVETRPGLEDEDGATEPELLS